MRLASEKGLFYPPDPGSIKVSTIGGNVANNSGGLRGLKHGVGLAKKEFLPEQFQDASFGMLQKVKRALDPDKILNPGKIFDVV